MIGRPPGTLLKPAAFMHQMRPLKKRLLGLDVSISAVGVASSDVSHSIAAPMTTLTRNVANEDAVFLKLQQIVETSSIGGIVVGWPVNTRGQMDESCFLVQRFVAQLAAKLTSMSLTLWDERGSSGNAKALLLENNTNRRPNKRKPRKYDDLAATFMLQSFLDEFESQ